MTAQSSRPGARTDTNRSGRRRDQAPRKCPILFRVFEATRPLARPARWRLSDFTEVTVGRGTARPRVSESPAGRKLELWLADTFASSQHTVLKGDQNGWTVEDRNSKNGTIVNGVKIKSHRLDDGDVLEIGRTFLIFRDERALSPDEREAAELDDLDQVTPELATIVPELGRAFLDLQRAVRAGLSVMIGGPTGAGKEVVARSVLRLTGRKGDFVAVNCADLAANLVESLLFGHRKGAFSGAMEDHIGFLRAADGGVLFLDEVGDMAAPAQSVLLRALETRTVTPVGGVKPITVDFHLVSATNRPLLTFVESERFREDLFARLDGYRLELPALADRREDLGLIIGTLLARIARHRASKVTFDSDAARLLIKYEYPRNVRELQRILASALASSTTNEIMLDDIPEDIRTEVSVPEPANALEPARVEQLRAGLEKHRGNLTAMAREMGKDRRQVARWLQRAGLEADKFRK